MYGSLLQPEIHELIEQKDFSLLREIFGEWTAADLAELLSEIPRDQQVVVFRLLPRRLSTETFEHLDLEVQMNLLKAMGQKEIAGILNEMSPDDRTALLEELPPAAVKQFLTLLSREEQEIARSLLGYPDRKSVV